MHGIHAPTPVGVSTDVPIPRLAIRVFSFRYRVIDVTCRTDVLNARAVKLSCTRSRVLSMSLDERAGHASGWSPKAVSYVSGTPLARLARLHSGSGALVLGICATCLRSTDYPVEIERITIQYGRSSRVGILLRYQCPRRGSRPCALTCSVYLIGNADHLVPWAGIELTSTDDGELGHFG